MFHIPNKFEDCSETFWLIDALSSLSKICKLAISFSSDIFAAWTSEYLPFNSV